MTPKWAQDLIIDACLFLGIEDMPDIKWRHRKGRLSSGHALYTARRITITAGSNHTDAKMVVLHELSHIAKPGHDLKVTYQEWHDRGKAKGYVVSPINPAYKDKMIVTKHVSHTDEFWDTAWKLYRWAKLPIRYCLQRETDYRKGAAVAYHRGKQ